MRTPSLPAPEVSRIVSPDSTLADLCMKVVTPMFGGGVDTGELDVENLIRPASIRGHLRFWWRACNAARFATLAELHEEERALWGAAAKDNNPSYSDAAIRIRITEITPGPKFTHQPIPRLNRSPLWVWQLEDGGRNGETGPDYVLFPFKEQKKEHIPAREGMVDVTFRLHLSVAPHAGGKAEACKQAVERALWAWIVFGGIGSRTRRGCGTVFCTGNGSETQGEHQLDATLFTPPSGRDVTSERTADWIMERINSLPMADPAAPPLPVPSLAGCRLAIGTGQITHMDAWNSAIASLQDFLQGRGIGRNRGDGRPGQSFWPEVGAARRIMGFHPRLDDHEDTYTILPLDKAVDDQFPRADLGLPRQIKLASEDNAPIAVLERDQKDFTRMASPIILKALPVSATQSYSIALVLTAPHVWEKGAPGLSLNWPNQQSRHLTPQPLHAPGHSPTWPRTKPRNVDDDGVSSARDAFIHFARSRQGWREV